MRPFALALALSATVLAAGCKTTGSGKPPVYLIKVETGDTLAAIAVKYDTTWDRIAKLNGLAGGAPVKVGSVLRVEPGPGGYVAGGTAGYVYGKGAQPRPSNVASKLPGAVKARGGDDGEFQEDDFPDVERAEADGGKHGLFFGGGSSSSDLEWPLYGELSSTFGPRHGRYHNGIDIRAKKGTTVLAAAPGVVEFAGRQHGYGRVVIIRHKGVKSLYAHLNSINVKTGEKVTHSTEIGETGMSGNTTGPHLHFELRTLKNQAIDPLRVLSKDKLMAAAAPKKGHLSE